MQGKIVKGIAGFYYVHTLEAGVIECKAKGIFRNKKVKPLVGDNVVIDLLDTVEKKGNIIEILERTNQLIRPAVSNIDQALIIFAAAQPSPNLNLLDRFLVMLQQYNIDIVVCFNKRDMISAQEMRKLEDIYRGIEHKIIFTSIKEPYGIEEIRTLLKDKTTVLAGPSGVGKSSMINLLKPEAQMETGAISKKIERGKHTTRHSELFHIEGNTYIMDTPGFSSIFVDSLEKEELKNYFQEFHPFEEECRFQGCVHIHEPNCAVKKALENGNISKERYENYVLMYEELKEKRKY